jgi:hypothetical protein
MPAKTGLDALLRPEDSILVLIDHQPYQFANLNSHEPTMIVNNVIGLAKAASWVGTSATTSSHEGIAAAEGVEPVARPGPDQRPDGVRGIGAVATGRTQGVVPPAAHPRGRARQAGIFAGTNAAIETIGGRPPMSLEAFIEKHRKAFE